MDYRFIRNLLFNLDAENAHHLTMAMLKAAHRMGPVRRAIEKRCCVQDRSLEQVVDGLRFRNPVGLAAGFDKNAQFLNVLPDFGFGSIEVGTVTNRPQPGNARPRLFRLPQDEALLNRMGFNNHGAEVVAQRLTKHDPDSAVRLGINIGKNKDVPIEDAVQNYEQTFTRLFEYADYIVVNVSSPNTPGLRQLQEKGPLSDLLTGLQLLNANLARQFQCAAKPIWVKVAPDLTEEALLELIDVVRETHCQGIVATNTTISREGLKTPNVEALGDGGISGRPLTQRSLEIVKFLYQNAPDLTIIGVGGIYNGEDALAMIRAGASLVQVWTGFIYQGPQMIAEINSFLAKACKENHWRTIAEAIGIDALAD